MVKIWGKRNTPPLMMESVNFYNYFGNQFRSFSKNRIHLPQDPAILLQAIYPKEAPSYHKDTCSTAFIAAFLIVVRN